MGSEESGFKSLQASRGVRGGPHCVHRSFGENLDDEDHSTEKQREIIIGHSAKHRLLLVCFAAQQESVRIFSARKATKQERKDYEENITP